MTHEAKRLIEELDTSIEAMERLEAEAKAAGDWGMANIYGARADALHDAIRIVRYYIPMIEAAAVDAAEDMDFNLTEPAA